MPSIVTSKFRVYNADQFAESLNEAVPSYLYMFIGRIRPWSDDNAPPTPVDATANTDFEHWRDMLSMKRVQSTDISLAATRYDWTSSTVYTEYSNTVDMNNENFFVVTDDFNVYKCLFNNNGTGSTVKPTGTDTTSITTADGYVWKFMYTVSASDAVKFLTTNFIPVETLTANNGATQWDVQQASVNGAIEIVEVTAGGAQFDNYNTGTLVAVANTTQMTIASSGSASDDHYNNNTIYITGGTGVGEHQEVFTYNGTTKVLVTKAAFTTLLDTSSQYSIAPTVTISGDGINATAISTMNTTSNTVYSMTVTNQGQNYTRATIAVTGNTSSGVTAQAYIGPPGGHGSDAAQELMGYNVILNTKFDKDESGTFTTDNDFRVIGLIRDPLLANGSAATASTYEHTTNLTITGISGTFVADEVITGGTSTTTGYVVEANTTVVKATQTDGLFSVSETITGGTSAATGTVSVANNGPLLDHSGDIMYVEHRSPVSRATDQIEDVKLVVRF
tara:strand:+ start:7366 stop:8880 length:1515 start_codon:yes stop_codon:yes gene_type:complete